MNTKALLSRLERIEMAAFGIERDSRGDQWVDRERRLLRIYFAMGLTGSVIVGSIGLFVLLAIASGPGFDRWLGGSRQRHVASAWDAAPSRLTNRPDTDLKRPPVPPEVATLAVTQPEVDPRVHTQPPAVRMVAVVPLVQKEPSAAQAPRAKLPPKGRADAPSHKPPQSAVSAQPAAAEAPAPVEAAAVASAIEHTAGSARPEGIVNLGGPGRSAGTQDVTWWRKIWWGNGGLAVSEFFK